LTRLHRPSDSEDSSLPPALRRPRTARSAFSRCSRRQAVRLDARCCAAGGFAAAVLQARQRSTPPNSKPSTSPRAQGACLVAPAAQPRRSNTGGQPRGLGWSTWRLAGGLVSSSRSASSASSSSSSAPTPPAKCCWYSCACAAAPRRTRCSPVAPRAADRRAGQAARPGCCGSHAARCTSCCSAAARCPCRRWSTGTACGWS